MQLPGGINNRVYRCTSGATKFVIKGYASCPAGERDRMQSEVAFLRYAAQVATGYAPRLLHIDAELRCVVLEHIEGDAYVEGLMPPAQDVDAAVEFFRLLNADCEAARQASLLDAAEGFLRLTEHLENVHDRIAGMKTGHLPRAMRLEAEALFQVLRVSFERVYEKTTDRIDRGEVPDAIDPQDRCASPSDFGFHNAIRSQSGVRFFDFEFAGWDDPAKAVLDFVLQPRVPVHLPALPLLAALPSLSTGSIIKRCGVLGPILRLKWLCIVMAVLQPDRLGRLILTHPNTRPEELIQKRLRDAARYLQQGTSFGLH